MTDNARFVKVVVLCMNSEGQADFHTCTPYVSEEQITAGEHFELAKENAEDNGYTEPMIAFDINDPAAKQTAQLMGWLHADNAIRPLSADVAQSYGSREYFPGATVEEIGTVMMQAVIGDYDLPDTVPEWQWVERQASFAHLKNGTDGIHEFVVNLSRQFDDVPPKLEALFAQAKSKHLSYLVFHQGT